jgi:hypothetical protein
MDGPVFIVRVTSLIRKTVQVIPVGFPLFAQKAATNDSGMFKKAAFFIRN